VKASAGEEGRVVVSTQGHDRGRRFLVIGIVDERYVLIADGNTRKLDRPKKKQAKHLLAEPYMAPEAMEAVRRKAQTADSTIRKALKAYAEQPKPAPAGTGRNTDKEECALVQE